MGQIIMSALVILLTGSIPKFLFQVYNSPRNRFLFTQTKEDLLTEKLRLYICYNSDPVFEIIRWPAVSFEIEPNYKRNLFVRWFA